MTKEASVATRAGRTRQPSNLGQKLPPEPLTPDEAKALLRACSRRAPTGARNAALLAVLYRGGLRSGEALDLYPKDIDRKEGTLRILHGKGDRSRLVGLDAGAFALIERWLGKRKKLGIKRTAPLFCTLDGQPLDPSYVRHAVKRLATKAGIEKRVHPHGLRHTHAAELAREGVPMNVIQAQLGHSSLATTSRYLAHVAPQHVVEAMQAREWEL